MYTVWLHFFYGSWGGRIGKYAILETHIYDLKFMGIILLNSRKLSKLMEYEIYIFYLVTS